jgi:hypothetical protein
MVCMCSTFVRVLAVLQLQAWGTNDTFDIDAAPLQAVLSL